MAVAIWISTDYFKTVTHTSNDLDENKLQNSIKAVQDLYVQPVLGTDLYNKINSDITGSTLTGNYQTLVNTWVAPYLAWQTLGDAVKFWAVRIGNGGVFRRSGETSTALDQGEISALTNAAKQKAEFYKARLISYLQHNNSLFPEYSSNSNEDISPRNHNHSSAIYLGTNTGYNPLGLKDEC